MPTSYSFFKEEIKKWFLDNVSVSSKLLDVGPGIGTYSDLLRTLDYQLDAVEYTWKLKEKAKPLKIMYLAPHLSTGGMPAFLLKRIQALKEYSDVEISVVEYQCQSMDFIVQRNAIKDLVGIHNFWSLEADDKMALRYIINTAQPDIVHIDEMSERMDNEMIKYLYSSDRKYKIVETCHDISFAPSNKRFIPDAFLFCTPYHLTTFKDVPSDAYVVEFPVDDQHKGANGIYNFIQLRDKLFGKNSFKTQVLNVGLWAPWKNQAEGLEISRKYSDMHFHFVGNLAGNFKEYWEPLMNNVPSNVTIWGEHSNIDEFMQACDIFMFNSTWECNPLVLREAIGYGLPIIARNLPQYGEMFEDFIYPIDTDLNKIDELTKYEIPTNNTTEDFGKKHLNIYTKIMNAQLAQHAQLAPKVNITQHFVENPFLEIKGNSKSEFVVKFYDETDFCHYANTIRSNCWVKLNRSYYTKWKTQVWENGELIYENVLDYTGKRVYIAFDSESLGDTVAWMPYVLEFQKKHSCKVIVSTFKNFLFEKVYPELEFVKPGTTVNNLYGMYRIGWFYNTDMEPVLPNTIPLQQTASNILGLSFTEIIPNIDYIPKPRQNNFKYIAIATNSTAGCKFWVKEEWQKLVNHFLFQGYKVINVSKERNELEGVTQIKDTSMENTMHIIFHSEFLIGLSSGLSWLAWAMGKHVVMISNFTEANHEFQYNCTRITNIDVCHGCWNERDTIFNKGDWNWCKYHEHTPRMWECQKSITSDFVIQQIKKLL